MKEILQLVTHSIIPNIKSGLVPVDPGGIVKYKKPRKSEGGEEDNEWRLALIKYNSLTRATAPQIRRYFHVCLTNKSVV